MLGVRPFGENSVHETSQPEPQSERKKKRKQVFLEQMEQVVPWTALVELIALNTPKARLAGHRFHCKPCCAFTPSSNGSPCRTPAWKKPSFTRRCTVSLPSLKSLAACLTRAPSCVSATALKSTNWLSGYSGAT